VGYARDSTMQFFSSVNSRLSVPQVARYGLRSTWIFEYQGKFEDLLSRCKQHIFGSTKIVEDVDDMAAVFSYGKGKQKFQLTTGPMEVEQLKTQYLSFEIDSLPPIFQYVDVDFGDIETKQYSTKYLREFFDKAVSEGQKLAEKIASEVGVK
jgi:hypothetical protein